MATKDILLVDDCAVQLRLLSMILESRGFKVSAASDGFKALELLERDQYRVMITDFNMPGMNGIELAARVRNEHPATRVVLVTANAIPVIIQGAASAGISEIFSKLTDIETLLDSIRSALSGAPWQPARPPLGDSGNSNSDKEEVRLRSPLQK